VVEDRQSVDANRGMYIQVEIYVQSILLKRTRVSMLLLSDYLHLDRTNVNKYNALRLPGIVVK
jgi:hypothetical protein